MWLEAEVDQSMMPMFAPNSAVAITLGRVRSSARIDALGVSVGHSLALCLIEPLTLDVVRQVALFTIIKSQLSSYRKRNLPTLQNGDVWRKSAAPACSPGFHYL